MSVAEHIKRPTLHEELVERLRNLIVEDSLKPDEKVPEKELCDTFGVSRTPLREALKVLASEGLVVLNANRGAKVARVTRAELDNIFPVIAALEQLAGELACQHLDGAAVARIETQHKAMLAAFASRDRTSYFQANQEIHAALIHGANNEVLANQHRLLGARIRRARFMANLSEERWAQAIGEHEAMMARLRKRDGAGLGRIMKRHMMNKHAALIRALDAESQGNDEG